MTSFSERLLCPTYTAVDSEVELSEAEWPWELVSPTREVVVVEIDVTNFLLSDVAELFLGGGWKASCIEIPSVRSKGYPLHRCPTWVMRVVRVEPLLF